jgi:hypothetical protein
MKEGSIKKEQFEGLAYAYVEKKASEDTEASQDTEPSLEEKKE